MILPYNIRIGGQDINVVIKERLDNNKLGTICIAEGILQIAHTFNNIQQCESSKFVTFIHEVVHGVLDTMGESELSSNEKFVSAFSSLLVESIAVTTVLFSVLTMNARLSRITNDSLIPFKPAFWVPSLRRSI